MLTSNITKLRKNFKLIHSHENKKTTFDKLEFSQNFPKLKEFTYVQFCKKYSKGKPDRISSLNGQQLHIIT